jgi:hypothetical protein
MAVTGPTANAPAGANDIAASANAKTTMVTSSDFLLDLANREPVFIGLPPRLT